VEPEGLRQQRPPADPGARHGVAHPTFVDHAHIVAAIAMFGCIILVAWVNALSFERKQNDPNARNRYSAIAVAMLSVFVLLVAGGKYRMLLAEIDAIVLFAIFWGIQTEELWAEGSVRARRDVRRSALKPSCAREPCSRPLGPTERRCLHAEAAAERDEAPAAQLQGTRKRRRDAARARCAPRGFSGCPNGERGR
jgi:hypothetical protein